MIIIYKFVFRKSLVSPGDSSRPHAPFLLYNRNFTRFLRITWFDVRISPEKESHGGKSFGNHRGRHWPNTE